MGTGVRRINQALDEASLSPAGFDYDEHNFSTTLVSGSEMAGEKGGTLNGTLNIPLGERIVEMVKLRPGIYRKDIIEETGVSVRTVARCIAELVSGGEIERRGSKKTGGYWAL
jgi:ATP-dependent DNA helicase RecG